MNWGLMKFLVVDDHPEIAELAALLLEEEGHEVMQALDASEAEQKIRQDQFDMVFCDIYMQPTNGIALLRSLQQNSVPVPPFVFVTGGSDQAVLDEAEKISGRPLIMKPFSTIDLVSAATQS